VVEVTNRAWRDAEGRPREEVIREMIDEAVRRLLGTDEARQAWQQLFRPGDKVGLKFNNVTGNYGGYDPFIARAVTTSLVKAGLKPENIYVVEIRRARVTNPWTDFSPGAEAYEVGGPVPTRLTNFVLRLDAIINLPNLKDHQRVGVTGALKNISHSRSVITTPPHRYHEPVIREVICRINSLPQLRKRLRLHLMNGLFGVYERGPGVHPAYLFYHHSFFASRDPVAMDWVELEIVEGMRKAKGLPSLWTLSRHPGFLQRAGELGLGVGSLDRVEWVRVRAS